MTMFTRPVRLLAIAVSVIAIATPAAAQSWFGGVKSGAGQSSFTGDHEFAWKVAGPNITAFVERRDAGRISQLLEIGNSQRLGVSTTGGSTLTFSANYLDVLLLTKLEFAKRLWTRPFVKVGPAFVVGLDCNLEFVTGGLVSNTACDDATGTNRIDVGVAVAGGLNWSLGTSTLGIEARGSTSFRTVVVPLESKSSRSLAWSVLAGLSIPIQFSRARRPVIGPNVPTLEPIRITTISGALPTLPQELVPQSGAGASAKRITLTAVDADVRSLLIALAKEAGISLVVSNDVRRRVSVSFKDASPEEAIRAIIAEAGLTVVDPPSERAMPTVVFYQLPVSVDEAPAEAIAARFGLSADLAKWIVESRPAATATVPAAPPQRPDRQP